MSVLIPGGMEIIATAALAHGLRTRVDHPQSPVDEYEAMHER